MNSHRSKRHKVLDREPESQSKSAQRNASQICTIIHDVKSEITDEELKAACKNSASHEDDEELEYERDSSKWPIKAVELMVYHRLRLDAAYHSPKYTKNKLWDTISEHLKDGGFNFDGGECHLKFRNMLATYKKNVEKVNVYGEECIKWKWFSAFHQILKYKPTNNGAAEEQEETAAASTATEKLTIRGNKRPRREIKPPASLACSELYESNDTESRKWNRASIKMLLDLRQQTNESFNDPTSHKVTCWRKIAKLLRDSGYDVSERDCIIKWHNLINTYRSNLRRSQTDHVRWEWFDQMNELLKPITNGSPVMMEPLDSAAELSDHKPPTPKNPPSEPQHLVAEVILSDNESIKDNFSSYSDGDNFLFDDDSLDNIWKLDTNRHAKKAKKIQKAYWKEKLKLQRHAEHRKRREWAERKQIELQKISLKKQQLKIYHRMTKTLERLTASNVFRDLLANEGR